MTDPLAAYLAEVAQQDAVLREHLADLKAHLAGDGHPTAVELLDSIAVLEEWL